MGRLPIASRCNRLGCTQQGERRILGHGSYVSLSASWRRGGRGRRRRRRSARPLWNKRSEQRNFWKKYEI